MKKLAFLLTLLLLLPISVKAENKVYFEKAETTLKPGTEEVLNVVVNSDKKFKKVSFDVITTSEDITIESVVAAEGLKEK